MKSYIIIGGGAAGLTCAINLARNGNRVTVLENKSDVGKKILITGNGKCNFWNKDQDIRHYHSSDEKYLRNIITKENLHKTFNFIESLKFLMYEKNGYYYPYSNQASTVLDALKLQLKYLSVEVITNFKVESVQKKDQFEVYGNDKVLKADCLVLATGSNAGLKSEAIKGYDIAKSFGHKLVLVNPALTQLKSTGFFLNNWQGVRCSASVKLVSNDLVLDSQDGEVQLTNYGISGICIMQLSGLAVKNIIEKNKVSLKINFLPMYDYNSLNELLNKYNKNYTVIEVLSCMLNKKLANVIIEVSKINKDTKICELSDFKRNELLNNIVNFNLNIIGYNGLESSQVAMGGVNLKDVNPINMESRLVKDLYFAGEILDCNGECGGYNLSFAFLSALLVGGIND